MAALPIVPEPLASRIQEEQNAKLRDILNSWWGIKEGPKIRQQSQGIISAVGRTSVWVGGEWKGIFVFEFAEGFEHMRPVFDAAMQQRVGAQNIHDIG